MEAGRELDAVVARHVIGYGPDYVAMNTFPEYSTDIAAAREVIMKLVAQGGYAFRLDMEYGTPMLAEARFWEPTKGMHYQPFEGFGPIEQAICLAALRAKGVELE